MADNIPYSLAWFKQFCEDEGLMWDSYLVTSELKLAKHHAIHTYNGRKEIEQCKIDYPDIDWDSKMAAWFKRHEEERIFHMLIAVELAEISGKQGRGFNEFIGEELDRLDIPRPIL